MCVKLSPENLNFYHCPSHLTSTYTYEVTTTPIVCGGLSTFKKRGGNLKKIKNKKKSPKHCIDR